MNTNLQLTQAWPLRKFCITGRFTTHSGIIWLTSHTYGAVVAGLCAVHRPASEYAQTYQNYHWELNVTVGLVGSGAFAPSAAPLNSLKSKRMHERSR